MSEYDNDTPGGEEPAGLPTDLHQLAEDQVPDDMTAQYLEAETEHMADRQTQDDPPITTMEDQGIHVPTKPEGTGVQYDTDALDGNLEPDPAPEMPALADVDLWAMRLGDHATTELFLITRVPGGWLFNETFVPYIAKNREGAQ